MPKTGYLHEGSLPYGLDTKHDENECTWRRLMVEQVTITMKLDSICVHRPNHYIICWWLFCWWLFLIFDAYFVDHNNLMCLFPSPKPMINKNQQKTYKKSLAGSLHPPTQHAPGDKVSRCLHSWKSLTHVSQVTSFKSVFFSGLDSKSLFLTKNKFYWNIFTKSLFTKILCFHKVEIIFNKKTWCFSKSKLLNITVHLRTKKGGIPPLMSQQPMHRANHGLHLHKEGPFDPVWVVVFSQGFHW